MHRKGWSAMPTPEGGTRSSVVLVPSQSNGLGGKSRFQFSVDGSVARVGRIWRKLKLQFVTESSWRVLWSGELQRHGVSTQR